MQEIHVLQEHIARLKNETNAVILAHNYQTGPIQDCADLVGDSLELSRAAAKMECDVIIFCGVDFMAETAAILSPEKKVILPAPDACCPMAQMITTDELQHARERHPDAAVVCYVNTTADVKAESDVCCTSANAVKVVNSVKEERVIFVPDKNLARYVARFSKKEIFPWEGYCYVHDQYTPEQVFNARKLHPNAEVLVHPECRPEVIDLADGVYSTSGIVKRVCSGDAAEYVIGTEVGIMYRLNKVCSQKHCYPLSEQAVCTNMKKTTLEKVVNSLLNLAPQVIVPDDIAERARNAISRMLEIS